MKYVPLNNFLPRPLELKTGSYYSDKEVEEAEKKFTKQFVEEKPAPNSDAVEWHEWMTKYPSVNGIRLIIPRGKKEVWIGYWNNANRRFEEAIPEFTDKGIDVDYWAELPQPPTKK